jgi:hypothetical protein
MTSKLMIAQAQPAPQPGQPQPFQPPKVLPIPRLQSYGDATIGALELSANSKTCVVPTIVDRFRFDVFFTTCPIDKFLKPEYPECSCAAYLQRLDDFGGVAFKWGPHYHSALMPGIAFPLLWLALVLAILVALCAPAVYFFSYRMSRRELAAAGNPDFFLRWHRQRLSVFICMAMTCFGFLLVLLGIAGNATISLGEGWNITTTTLGIVFVFFGFLIWQYILRRPSYEDAQGPQQARTNVVDPPK